MSRGSGTPTLASASVIAVLLSWPLAAGAVTLEVVDPTGASIGSYRWLLEEDATFGHVAGVSATDTLGLNFHRSYMPAVASGDSSSASLPTESGKRYFVSVLPDEGFAMGGASIAAGQTSVTVVVNPLPVPTAQISVFVFEDTNPINNAPDQPQEPGLEGFTVVLEEAAGRYGANGGPVSQDAFGNPLGTTYEVDAAGNAILDASGAPRVLSLGTGELKTDANGELLIKNLSPGKYGVIVVPPAGQGWVQTSTIEGTKVIDAWVKANEPTYFAEFGPPGPHVFVGFLRPFEDASRLTGGSTVTGQIVNMRMSRPPDYAFYNGVPYGHTTAWVGLNDLSAGAGRGIYAQRCDEDGHFVIPNVPPGQYQLVVWDDNLDLIFAFHGFSIAPGGGQVALGDVPVFDWFAAMHHYVFNDKNENGVWDSDEQPLSDVPINLRWRDGTIYQSFPTDLSGYAPFDEVFPFFSWLVAEVDYSRFKATGATVVVDAGGPTNPADPWTFGGLLNPQGQPDNGGAPYRVETGPVLTQAFQAFLGQTNVIQWGKKAYGRNENGGITGIVYYAVTRAEDDPRWSVGETWEPGIPRVQVNLYADDDADGIADDQDGDGAPSAPDVDNAPFGFQDGSAGPGPEDVDRDGDGSFDYADALQITHTDSWDDNLPEGCPGDTSDPFYAGGKCYDGMRNWNQVRPGVFDGGYAFAGLPAGIYLVEAVPPRSALGQAYQIVKEEDRNVDFGEPFVPSPLQVPAVCVGDLHVVPDFLSLFPAQQIPATFAGQSRPLCDRKQVLLTNGINAAADFHMFTEVPIAGHIVGFVLDDTANEFDPRSPQFGEKFAPPWLPISIRDWTGRELSRVYSDQYGTYNALVPSTFNIDRPMPSGVGPNMLTVCLNDPVKPDPANPGKYVADPYFNRQYSQFCYTFQYVPGATTYLDTPVVRVAAFAGPDQFPLDCELADGTPEIYSVSGPVGGPYVAAAGQNLTIVSRGATEVANPAYDGTASTPRLVTRDFGFGAAAGNVAIGSTPLSIVSWAPGAVVAQIPAGAATGQLTLTRGDNGRATQVGITVTVGGPAPIAVPPGTALQKAIDLAPAGSLVMVPPGLYEEPIILWKPLRLQGWGAGSTVIKSIKVPAEKLEHWRRKVQTLVTSEAVTLLDGQNNGFGGMEPATLFEEEGAGILVLARDVAVRRGGFGLAADGRPNARIDGLTITGSDHAGGVVVNGFAHRLEISNNRITNNTGTWGGGLRVGHAAAALEQPVDAQNDNLNIHHNQVDQNGALGGAGGGISLYTGSTRYQVTQNYVCGNFTLGEGAGIAHQGLSDNGLIARNTVVFNHSFNQGRTVSGGGILVAGDRVLTELTPGSGSVRVIANLVQGNLAGGGDGGGIRLSRTSGEDVDRNPNNPSRWHHVQLVDNVIVDNVAALAGGGISLQDAARASILHNTVAYNDAASVAGEAFAPGNPNRSVPQPAGIVSHANSAELKSAMGRSRQVLPFREFSNPALVNTIVWRNRSFFFDLNAEADPAALTLVARSPDPTWDLAVLGASTSTAALAPRNCLLTSTAGYDATNFSADPMFEGWYANGARGALVMPELTTGISVAPALDEGGNFIDLHFGPLTRWNPATGASFSDYHLQQGSPAQGRGDALVLLSFPETTRDFDGETRPDAAGTLPDVGADERAAAAPPLSASPAPQLAPFSPVQVEPAAAPQTIDERLGPPPLWNPPAAEPPAGRDADLPDAFGGFQAPLASTRGGGRSR